MIKLLILFVVIFAIIRVELNFSPRLDLAGDMSLLLWYTAKDKSRKYVKLW